MRTAVRYAWRGAAMVAFGATAALAVTLNRPDAVPASLTTSARPVPRCVASRLAVSLADSVEGSRYPVNFTNTSRGACSLIGYPDVAAYQAGDTGLRQVGIPADRLGVGEARRILLQPGATAHAEIDLSAPRLETACQPVSVTGLRIVPPGASRAWYLRAPLKACSVTGPRALAGLRVRAIAAGPGNLRMPVARPLGTAHA